jgi:plastocyanin
VLAVKTTQLVLSAVASAVALGGALATATSATGQSDALSQTAAAGKVDPRAGGFEIGLGEWALLPEARALRPGTVTFVIRNRGKFEHGFEIEIRRVDRGHGDRDDDDDRVRADHDDDAETARLRPGQVARLTMNLAPGFYEIECFVSHHDDMGMRGVLEVREDAPLIAPPSRLAGTLSNVDIVGFAFKPATLKTTAGKVVTWRNLDPAPHTATGEQIASPQLGKGASFQRRFSRPGTYTYVCALHPGMRGKVIVSRSGPG